MCRPNEKPSTAKKRITFDKDKNCHNWLYRTQIKGDMRRMAMHFQLTCGRRRCQFFESACRDKHSMQIQQQLFISRCQHLLQYQIILTHGGQDLFLFRGCRGCGCGWRLLRWHVFCVVVVMLVGICKEADGHSEYPR